MSKSTRILIVEDLQSDFELAQLEIGKSIKECVFKQVETRQDFLNALDTFHPDVILSDYSLPRFDGMNALKLAKEQAPLTPFIIWTGSMSEDIAVECMRAGANNYILKENLKRLGPAVLHSLHERHLLLERQQGEEMLRRSEARFVTIFENSPVAIGISRLNDGKVIHANPAFANLYEYSREEIIGRTTAELSIWANLEDLERFIGQLQTEKHIWNFEATARLKSGKERQVIVSGEQIDIDGEPCLMAQILDITELKQAEQKSRESEERLRSLIENSLDNISLLASDGTLLWENPAVNRTLGYEQDEFIDRNIFELMHPDDMSWTNDLFTTVVRHPESQQRGTFRLKHHDGTWRWIEATATNMLDNPSVNAVVINYRDVTERKLAEIKIQQRNDDLQLINTINEMALRDARLDEIANLLAKELKRTFSSTGSTLYILSPDGTTLTMQQYFLSPEITRRIEKIIGSTIPLIQLPIQENGFFHKILNSQHGSITVDREETEKWMAEFLNTPFLPPVARDALRKLIPQIYELLNIKSTIAIPLMLNGKTIGLLDVSSAEVFTEDDLERIENISRQLTAAIQRQQAIEQIRRSEAFLQSVQNALSASIAILNEEGVIVQVNAAWRKFGEQNGLQHPEYCVGMNYLDICDADTGVGAEAASMTARYIREMIAGKRQEAQVEYACHSPEEKRWFNLRITKFDDGDHIWAVLAHENITERKQAEDALKETSEQFRTLFEASPEAIMLINPQSNWTILDCNTAACSMNGYARNELIGQSIDILNLTPGNPTERLEYLEKIRATGILRYEDQHRRKDGTVFPIEVSTSIIMLAGREVVLGIDRDITERKHAEEALRENEKRYRALFENVPIAVWEEDFSEAKKHLDRLKQQGITDFSVYFEKHPDALTECMEAIKVLDVNNTALEMYEAPSKEELIRATIQVLSKGEQENDTDDLIAIAQGRTSHGWEGSDETITGRPIEISLTWSVVPGYEADYSRIIVTTADITARKKAEEALRQSESRYRTVVENQSEFIVRWTPDGKRTFVNEAYCRYFGIDLEQAFTSNFMPLIHEEDRAAVEDKIARLLVGTISVETDVHRVIKADGSIGWQEWTDHAIRDKDGNLIEFQSVGRDITERKQAEDAEREQRALAEALRDTAEILNSTLEYGEVLDHILTAVGHVVPHDAATIMLIEKETAHVARMKGYAERGFVAEVMKIELPLMDTVNLQQMLNTRRPVVVSDTHSYPGWKVMPATAWIRSNVGAPISVSEEVVGFILLDSETPGFFTPIHAERLEAFADQAALAIHNARLLRQAQEEIAERKQVEKELRASEERFHQLANNIKEAFWIADVTTNTDLYLSPAYESIWGHPPELQYKDPQFFIENILPEDRPAVQRVLDIQRSGQSTEMEYRIQRPDGSVRWIWDRAFPIFDDSGRVVNLAGIAADITERKQAETALRERDALLLESQRVAQLGHYRLDIRSGHWESSETLNMVFGIDKDYITDINGWVEIVHPAQRDEMRAYFADHVVEKRNTFNREYRIVKKSDGQERWVHGLGQLEFDNEGKPIRMIGTIQDITERKLAEEALRESEERFSSAFEFAPIGIALVSLDGCWMKVNRAICKLLGYAEEELLTTTFQNVSHPDDLNIDLDYIQQLLVGKINTYQMEKRYIHKLGHLVWALLSVSLIKDHTGNPKYFISQIQDITERKRNEAEAQRHLAELEALYENGLAVGQLLNPREIGERIITTFARHLSWHHVAIRLLQPGSDHLELIAFNLPGINETSRTEFEHRFRSVINKTGQGLSGWVAQTGKPFRTGNVHISPQYIDTYAGIQSGLYMPLKIGNQILGVISVESEEPNAFTTQDERLLATLANQAAVAFENARLYQTIQQERERFSELFENTPVATWLEDFSAVVTWMDGLRAEGIVELKNYLESHPEQYKRGVGLIDIVDVNHAAVVMNGARNREELIENVHELMMEDTPSSVMINELDLIWKGYTSFGFEMSSRKLDGSIITGIQRIYIPTSNNEPDYGRVIVTSTDITERVGFEQQLRTSEVHYRELADSITDIFFELDQNMRYSHWNRASELLTGVTAKNAIGKTMTDVFGASEAQKRIEAIYKEVLEKHSPHTFETMFLVHEMPRNFEINAYPSTRGVAVVAKDVTERKRSESLMQKRFELMEYSSEHNLEELMQKALDEISEWTNSAIGFFQLIKEDQITPSLQVWSTDTFKHFHTSEVEEMHKPADQAGVWAEAIHQRRAIIHNDYASLPGKKGLPEGHAPMLRELVLPIIRNEKIMAVIGVGNKSQEYNRDDLEITERFADYAWDIIERKQMAIEIAEERNQLAKRVEERTSDLSRANSNLARALRVKDEFLANMSHELRTPLNAILGLSESLSEQTAGPLNEKQQRYLTTISESGHHLLSLINDILDLAKIEAGQITLDINKVDVNSVSQASLRMIKQLAQKKNLDVSVEIDKKVGLMWADERRLKQMIVNLLSNAVKFTPEGGMIGLQITGEQEDNKVMIAVWDTGIGIKESDYERLFQPFVQLDSGLARESSGTGLGLALVAQMARMHGGSVRVESNAGKGSRFTIILPWEPALAADTVERMKVTGKFRAIQPGQTQQTILLIEDTQEVVMMIKDYLEISGYNVATAQDGLDGITQAKFTHPDLILMDIQMPRMDGLEATKKLRQDPEFMYTPIIALTALAMPNDRERCIAAGMDEYISKPVNLRGLVKLIQNYISLREEKKQPR